MILWGAYDLQILQETNDLQILQETTRNTSVSSPGLGKSGVVVMTAEPHWAPPSAGTLFAAAAAAKSLQSPPTLFDPIDGSPPGSTVPGILQARTLEWVAVSISNAGLWPMTKGVKQAQTIWINQYEARHMVWGEEKLVSAKGSIQK